MKNIYLQKEIKWAIKSSRVYSLVLLFFAVLIFTDSKSQVLSSEVWSKGQIILATGDSLMGYLKFDSDKEVVQFKHPSGRNEAFSPRKVLLFQIDDKLLEKNRTYFSLPLGVDRDFEKLKFFEVIAKGKLTLFSKERIAITQHPSGLVVTGIENDFYLLMKGKELQLFDGKKRTLLNMMYPETNDVKNYMRENKLKVLNRDGLLQIVSFYNSLQ